MMPREVGQPHAIVTQTWVFRGLLGHEERPPQSLACCGALNSEGEVGRSTEGYPACR